MSVEVLLGGHTLYTDVQVQVQPAVSTFRYVYDQIKEKCKEIAAGRDIVISERVTVEGRTLDNKLVEEETVLPYHLKRAAGLRARFVDE